tara:strand:+ start:276 stop:809 length:534 start_codon:yes stop_codon:yes gene_type:complete
LKPPSKKDIEEAESAVNAFLSKGEIVKAMVLWEEALHAHKHDCTATTLRNVGNAYVLLGDHAGIGLLRESLEKLKEERVKEERESGEGEQKKNGEPTQGSREEKANKKVWLSEIALANGLRDMGHLLEANTLYESTYTLTATTLAHSTLFFIFFLFLFAAATSTNTIATTTIFYYDY